MYDSMACAEQICGYEVIETLGHGARSTIFAVKDREGQVYALKRVIKREPTDQKFLDQAQNEHEVSTRFDHHSLRRSFHIIRQRKLIRTSQIVILMEMIDGLTMEQITFKNPIEICKICQHVTDGLGAIHAAGYVHADIKPNNILVTDNQNVKIIDFGQSCKIGTVKSRIQGTPDYIAPEQVHRRQIVPQTDVFNLGATMYWLFTGKHIPTLIPHKKSDATLTSSQDCPPPNEINDQIPPALSSLIMSCIQKDPQQRPDSMQRVNDRLDLAIKQYQDNTETA